MKVILSRKGFDAANGGCPSPIMPDNTLLSFPIPSDDGVGYEELSYRGLKYSDLLAQLNPGKVCSTCHLDPDIREGIRPAPPSWRPAFGQIGAAQGLLSNAKVEAGDLFLFFGWFRRIERHGGAFRYVRKNAEDFYNGADLQVIYGYLQIGEILTDRDRIAEYGWHPHASAKRLENASNALYTPTEELSFLPGRKGYDILDYREDRVLTGKNQSRATWRELGFLLPQNTYGKRKNSAKGPGLYYGGIWQELVVYETEELMDWVKRILE